jgi:hypothetical protein
MEGTIAVWCCINVPGFLSRGIYMKRIKITNPLTQKVFEGSGEYTAESSQGSFGRRVWEIALDNGERLSLSDDEVILYGLQEL